MASRDDEAREAWLHATELFLSSEMRDRIHEACAAVGLPHPGSLKALILLDEPDAPSMRHMAEALRCDASYITGLVDALEDLDYVERRGSTTDRRVKLVHLTDRGRRARADALAVMTEPPKGFESLSDAEIRTLNRLIGKVATRYPGLS
ncbi:MAG: MarR family transcriptional regulator [Microthrixaceae bacterium]